MKKEVKWAGHGEVVRISNSCVCKNNGRSKQTKPFPIRAKGWN